MAKKQTKNPLEEKALTLLDQAKAMPPVKSDEEYESAGQIIMAGKELIAKITDAHKESIDTAHKAHKAAIALRDSQIKPINDALRIVEPLLLSYKQERDRAAAEEARRKAEAERKQKLAAVAIAADFGDEGDADKQLELATAPTRPLPIPSTLPKIDGMFTRKGWTYEIIDPKAVKREYCLPSESLIKISVESAFYKISKITPEMVKEYGLKTKVLCQPATEHTAEEQAQRLRTVL